MENLLGLLRIHVKRGVNLAIRDISSSDPYVVVHSGKQVKDSIMMPFLNKSCDLKTRVVKHSLNPDWNDHLTLSVTDPNLPVKLTVYDYDLLSADDKMGEAEFNIAAYLEAIKFRYALEGGLPDGTIIMKIQPSRQNCLSEESHIVWNQGKLVQNMFLRLQHVECGEVEIHLEWIDIPGSRGI
ncbi:protein C2-DOMAIN ABA-RELATED 1 isoform X2 [Brassica rapa]|uniref:protein C2-DOMAIN ABA-RELATED 1 isoform X2 n=1 Tax=Brassica campestris TaxID=3711 RepID=UPI00142E0749|nr:protein C2-DOMAIN ABA-RELATED 1 isoform X2 [Brassica rapa]